MMVEFTTQDDESESKTVRRKKFEPKLGTNINLVNRTPDQKKKQIVPKKKF